MWKENGPSLIMLEFQWELLNHQMQVAFSLSVLAPCLWPLLRKTFLLSQYLTHTSFSLTKERAIFAVSQAPGTFFMLILFMHNPQCLTLTVPCPYLNPPYPTRNLHRLRLGGQVSVYMMLGNHPVRRSSPSQDKLHQSSGSSPLPSHWKWQTQGVMSLWLFCLSHCVPAT